jgi:hypothetical protein
VVCVPATINNDLPGTEITIGADTALNTIVNDVDKIKESAVAPTPIRFWSRSTKKKAAHSSTHARRSWDIRSKAGVPHLSTASRASGSPRWRCAS